MNGRKREGKGKNETRDATRKGRKGAKGEKRGGSEYAQEPFGLSAGSSGTEVGRREKYEQRNEEVQRQLRYSITSGISSASKLYAKCTRKPPRPVPPRHRQLAPARPSSSAPFLILFVSLLLFLVLLLDAASHPRHPRGRACLTYIIMIDRFTLLCN